MIERIFWLAALLFVGVLSYSKGAQHYRQGRGLAV